MGKHTDQRDRTLCLVRILYEQTDEKHPLTTPQLIRRLEKAGLTAERKSVYRDLGAMKKWGFPIDHRRGLGGGWYMASHPLDLDALQAAVDALAGENVKVIVTVSADEAELPDSVKKYL